MNIAIFIDSLDKNTGALLDSVTSLSEKELFYKHDERWCTMEILEHIYITDRLIMKIISGPSEQSHSDGVIIGDDKMKRIVVEKRHVKITAPDTLLPTGTISSLADFDEKFKQQRDLLKTNLLQGETVVDNRIYKHPVIGDMTVADWLHFMIRHTERHMLQIQENKGHYPPSNQ